MKYVVNYAIDVDAKSSEFPKDWIFHLRWSKGKKGDICLPNGNKICFETVGGRTSAIVPKEQKKKSNTPRKQPLLTKKVVDENTVGYQQVKKRRCNN